MSPVTATVYLEPGEPGSFTDWPRPPAPGPGDVLCPVCQGHGGWNTAPGHYPLPRGVSNTAENRRLYCHLRGHCTKCNGYGVVKA